MIDDAAGRGTHRRVEERRADRRVDSFEDEVYVCNALTKGLATISAGRQLSLLSW